MADLTGGHQKTLPHRDPHATTHTPSVAGLDTNLGGDGDVRRMWEDLGWVDVEEYLKLDDRVIVPVGSCEQHGRHLSFATDYLIPLEIARRVAEKTGVLATPPLCFGMSLHHMGFPGTISLSPDTFVAAIRDILRSLHRHGFRRVLVLNGHGGNAGPLVTAVIALLDQLRDLQVKIGNWWQEPRVATIIQELWGEPERHATAAETSAVLAIRPTAVRLDRAAYSKWVGGLEFRGPSDWKALFPHGAVGVDPSLASAEAGERIIETAVYIYAAEIEAWPPRSGF